MSEDHTEEIGQNIEEHDAPLILVVAYLMSDEFLLGKTSEEEFYAFQYGEIECLPLHGVVNYVLTDNQSVLLSEWMPFATNCFTLNRPAVVTVFQAPDEETHIIYNNYLEQLKESHQTTQVSDQAQTQWEEIAKSLDDPNPDHIVTQLEIAKNQKAKRDARVKKRKTGKR